MLLRALINESVRGREAGVQSPEHDGLLCQTPKLEEKRGEGSGGRTEGEGGGGRRGEGWRQHQGKCKHGVRFKEEGQGGTGRDRGVIGQRVLGGEKSESDGEA